MYRRQLTAKSRIDFATYLASYSYDMTPQRRLAAGYTMRSDRFWVKGDDLKKKSSPFVAARASLKL